APLPLLKKAGENQLDNFSGFPTDYAGGPLIGSGPLVLFAGSQGEKGWRMDRLAGGKSQRPGRGGGRAQRAQSMGGGPWPPRMLWFCGPGALWAPGPQNAAAPPAQPRRPSPTPRQRGPGGP